MLHMRSTWLQFLLTSETSRKIGLMAREKAKVMTRGLMRGYSVAKSALFNAHKAEGRL